jgi:acetoin utilization deacetylase AcuC-like enzyme
MSLIVISTERFAEHMTPPGHPECPERAEVMDAVAARWRQRGGEVVAPREATREQLTRVHESEYVHRIAETAGSAVAFDMDTYTSPETYEIALLAAGAAVDAVERVMGGSHTRSFALMRPPGHHAERERAMGFCFFNNIAVAAAHARALGAARVAIVDYDVHHGNGTQNIFYRDPDVLYLSIHQYPYYPGTGSVGEVGDQAGAGFTVNLPLEAGAVDEDYHLVFDHVVLPILRQFAADILLVSAGFDAHERDPLGGMRLTSPGFAAMTRELRFAADECCGGRLVALTEGGYDLQALNESMQAVADVLADDRVDQAAWPLPSAVSPVRGRAAVDAARSSLSQFWRL